MEKTTCSVCLKPKASLQCGVCQDSICKYCAQFLDEDSFSFFYKKKPEISHTTYCNPCFSVHVTPALESYAATMERAKNTLIYNKVQFKETRFIRRDADPLSTPECASKEEVLMRLAFHAALRDFNSVIDVEVTAKKVRNGAYQTTMFTGTGIPAHLNPDKLVKDKSFKSQPN